VGAAKAIAKHPQLLRLSVEHNLNPKLRYLAEEVGLGRDGAAKVILRCPQVLGFNVECNLTPKVRFLVEETGAGREGAADLILAYPSLLCMSIERTLRPTLCFLVENFPETNAADALRTVSPADSYRGCGCCGGTAKRGASPPPPWPRSRQRSSARRWA
jgi:hypothetical protein